MTTPDPILIDGSLGEGGGQILRSALGLSMVTGRPFRVENIRAGREKPGLLRQHLTAVHAAAEICGAQLEGAEMGSRELAFRPGSVRAGDYQFSIGSAGSTTLVLQAILPALLCADGPSNLTLEGGTHNPFAPPLEFIEHAFLPILARMGPAVSVALERVGFYPAGGGRFFVSISPSEKLSPLHLESRGRTTRRLARAIVAGLPGMIGIRELKRVEKMLGWTGDELQMRQLPDEQGPGNILLLMLHSEEVTEVFTGFGMRGVSAEAVAETPLQQLKRYLAADAPVGEHLADQLLIPLAMAGEGSMLTQALSRHSMTNIDVIRQFLDVKILIENVGKDRDRVVVHRRA